MSSLNPSGFIACYCSARSKFDIPNTVIVRCSVSFFVVGEGNHQMLFTQVARSTLIRNLPFDLDIHLFLDKAIFWSSTDITFRPTSSWPTSNNTQGGYSCKVCWN